MTMIELISLRIHRNENALCSANMYYNIENEWDFMASARTYIVEISKSHLRRKRVK